MEKEQQQQQKGRKGEGGGDNFNTSRLSVNKSRIQKLSYFWIQVLELLTTEPITHN